MPTAQYDFPPGGGFIRLKPTKAPLSWDLCDPKIARAFPNVGIMMSEPWIVVDIDEWRQAEKLLTLVVGEEIRCRVMQTSKGMHFWFRISAPLKNSTRTMTGIGLRADYRSWGKNSQVCVKLNGEWREWLVETPWDEIEEIPRWLRPLKQDKWKFYEMGEGSGRNDALFVYQNLLAERAYSIDEAHQVIRLINQYIFELPLPESELKLVSRPEAYPTPHKTAGIGENLDEQAIWFHYGPRGQVTFLHNVMGDVLREALNIVCWNDELYVYQDGYYQHGEPQIFQEIVTLWAGSKKTNQSEVINYLKIVCNVDDKMQVDEYMVNLKNGRFDLRTFELLPHSPEHLDFQRINAAHDKKAFSRALDGMLLKVFCDDLQLYDLFEEIMGYCLVRNSDFHKLFVFTGDGSNGKSTVLKVIKHFLGAENVSSVSLQGLEDKFKTAELENKLANLGDDIPFLRIKDSSQMKVLASGDPLMVERKNRDPFTLRNHAKLIFSTNKMPNIADETNGMGRRLCIIPFEATITNCDPDFDPRIAEKVTGDEAMSHLLGMAICGWRRLQKRGRFTVPVKVKKALESFQRENSNTRIWIADLELTAADFIDKGTRAVYQEHLLYCEQNHMQPKTKRGFTIDIINIFSIGLSKLKKVEGVADRYFEVGTE